MNYEWIDFLENLKKESKESGEAFCDLLKQAKGWDEAIHAGKILNHQTKRAWTVFLTLNRHSRTTWDVADPSWGDEAGQLVPLVKAMLRTPLPSTEPSTSELSTSMRMANQLRQAGFGSCIPWVQRSIQRYETFVRIDEEQYFLSEVFLDLLRSLIRTGGAFLKKEQLLNEVDDVFFLKLEELKEQLGASRDRQYFLGFMVERRRAEWKRTVQGSAMIDC
jgi:hypothetical protein